MEAVSPPEPTLIVIGLWRDRAEPYWPDPKDFIDEQWDATERAAVVHALRNARTVREYRGESTCRICGRLNGAKEVTDGTYLWPDGLAHYVSEHAVRLPEPVGTHFVRQQKAADTVPSDPPRDSQLAGEAPSVDLAEADESWWLSFGSADWA